MDSKKDLQDGFEMLLGWSRLIAILPLEEWREALDRAESIAPFTDPTLMQKYIGSDKPKILKSIIDAAIPLKRAVLAAQPAVAKEMELEKR